MNDLKWVDMIIILQSKREYETIMMVKLKSTVLNSRRWVGLFVGSVDLQLPDIGTLLLQRKQKTVTLTSTVDKKPLKIPSFVVYLIQVHTN